jgi:hypothetical protein
MYTIPRKKRPVSHVSTEALSPETLPSMLTPRIVSPQKSVAVSNIKTRLSVQERTTSVGDLLSLRGIDEIRPRNLLTSTDSEVYIEAIRGGFELIRFDKGLDGEGFVDPLRKMLLSTSPGVLWKTHRIIAICARRISKEENVADITRDKGGKAWKKCYFVRYVPEGSSHEKRHEVCQCLVNVSWI